MWIYLSCGLNILRQPWPVTRLLADHFLFTYFVDPNSYGPIKWGSSGILIHSSTDTFILWITPVESDQLWEDQLVTASLYAFGLLPWKQELKMYLVKWLWESYKWIYVKYLEGVLSTNIQQFLACCLCSECYYYYLLSTYYVADIRETRTNKNKGLPRSLEFTI